MKKDKAPLTETPLNRMSPAFPTKQHLEDRNPLQGIPLVALNQNTLVALRLHLNAYISLACSLSIALKTGPEFGNVMGVGQAYLTNQRISLEGPRDILPTKMCPWGRPKDTQPTKGYPWGSPGISSQTRGYPWEGPKGQGWPCQGWPC